MAMVYLTVAIGSVVDSGSVDGVWNTNATGCREQPVIDFHIKVVALFIPRLQEEIIMFQHHCFPCQHYQQNTEIIH